MRIVQGPSGFSTTPSVNKLRVEELAVWVDTGDFAAPGALVALAGGPTRMIEDRSRQFAVGFHGYRPYAL
jgi:hypothetical protein